MTDLYIEQASGAFRQLWATNGQMTVSIPSLGDSMQVLQRRARDTDEAVHQIAVRVDAQQRLLETTRADVTSLHTAVQGLSRRLDGLLEGRDGFVTRSALQHEVVALPVMHDVRRMKEDLDTQTKRLDECVADMEMRSSSVQRVVTENLTRLMTDELRALQQAHNSLAQETTANVQRLTSSVNRFPALLQDLRGETATQLQTSVHQLTNHIQQTRTEFDAELESSNTEVLSHLKRQAQVIDSLSEEVHTKSKNTLRGPELIALREEMKETREDMEKAQFRIQEAYSQIMSLTRQAAELQSSRMQTTAVPRHGVPSTPRQHPTAVTSDSVMAPDLSQIHAGGDTSLPPPLSSSSPPAGVGQLDPLMISGLQRLLTSTVPTLVAALGEQRSATDVLQKTNQRNSDLLRNLLSCVGVSPEDLLGSLEVLDRGHVLHLLRKVQSLLMGSSGAPVGAASSASPLLPSAARELAPAPSSSTPLVMSRSALPVVSRPAPPDQFAGPELGVDVADGLRGDGARIMSIVPGSFADKAGLLPGDVVSVVDDVVVENSEVFAECVKRALESGRRSLKLSVTNASSQRRHTVMVKLS